MKIKFTHEVTLFNRSGHIEQVWPARTHSAAVMIADLWIIKQQKSKKPITSALAVISGKVQTLDTKIDALGKVKLLEDGKVIKTFRMYHQGAANDLGYMWRTSGANRTSRRPRTTRPMPMGQATSTHQVIRRTG